jgi:transposase
LHLYEGQPCLSMIGMKPYSLDLREKILRAYDARLGSQRALAALFGVSRTFVEQLLQRRRSTGTIAPRPHAGGRKPSCDAAAQEAVRQLLCAQADATLEELWTRLLQRQGLRVSVPTMSRLLTRLGLPRNNSRSTPRSVRRHGSSRRAHGTGR